MRSPEDLIRTLDRMDGRGYRAYKDIVGAYRFPDYELFIDYVQGDPFAGPSDLRIRLPQDKAAFPEELYRGTTRRTALEDYLTRAFAHAIRRHVRGHRGTGKSGDVAILRCGQEILERNSFIVDGSQVEARFSVGLPAAGRRVLAGECKAMLFEELPELVSSAMYWKAHPAQDVRRHVETAEDAVSLRGQLAGRRLAAFVADGALLPRVSGVDDRPLAECEHLIRFKSPGELEVELECPNRGAVTGMGIPEGVTLIVGGGYHGKSTLLKALERGVYNHIPGDGREHVVTVPSAVKIRAEDGRRVEQVDISPFIRDLPFGRPTDAFSTEDASGSTSQAANIIESLEVGAQLLLIDEDTSATNFMVRDHKMQELVARDKEPITPFVDKVRQLYEQHGISTVLVMGGVGDYFEVADTVIMMDSYLPREVTAQAHEIAGASADRRVMEGGESFGTLTARVPMPGSFDPSSGKRDVKIRARGTDTISFGRHDIDLSLVEQLVDTAQTRAIGDIIHYAVQKHMGDGSCLADVIDAVERDLDEHRLDHISPMAGGKYARPRRLEIAAAINRLRTLRVRPRGTSH